MSQFLEPRSLPNDVWKRWWRQGARLAVRSAPTLLPLVVLVGLAVGTFSQALFGVGAFLFLAVSGMWQAMLLSLLEQSARGKRLDLGMAWQALLDFLALPGRIAQQQLTVRFAWSLAAVGGLFVLVWLAQQLIVPTDPPPAPRAPPSQWEELFFVVRDWGLVFIWSWVLQVGGTTSMSNYLVRNYGLTWEQAHELNQRAVRKNLGLSALKLSFLFVMFSVMFGIVFTFVLEILWLAIMTVAARDLFEQKDALDPVEAREAAPVVALGV